MNVDNALATAIALQAEALAALAARKFLIEQHATITDVAGTGTPLTTDQKTALFVEYNDLQTTLMAARQAVNDAATAE